MATTRTGLGDIAGLGRRARLDRGALGVVAVNAHSARDAAGLLTRRHSGDLSVLTAQEVTVTADTDQVPVGIDGEAVFLPVPVRCAVRPGALRVWVPRDRPAYRPSWTGPPAAPGAAGRRPAARSPGCARSAPPGAAAVTPRPTARAGCLFTAQQEAVLPVAVTGRTALDVNGAWRSQAV